MVFAQRREKRHLIKEVVKNNLILEKHYRHIRVVSGLQLQVRVDINKLNIKIQCLPVCIQRGHHLLTQMATVAIIHDYSLGHRLIFPL